MTILEEQMQQLARLTEEQVQAVHRAVASTGEMEALLAGEQRRAAQLEEQMESVRMDARHAATEAAARMSEIETRLMEQQKRAMQLEEQVHIVRAEAIEAVSQAATRIAELEGKLGEEEQRSAQLTERISHLEPIAACVDKFSQALGEIARFSNKPVAV